MIPKFIHYADQGRAIDKAIGTLLRRRSRLSPGDAATLAGLEAARVVSAQLADMAAASSDATVGDVLARGSSTARSDFAGRTTSLAA